MNIKYIAVMLFNIVAGMLYLLSIKGVMDSIVTEESLFQWFVFMAVTITAMYFIKKTEINARESYLKASEDKITGNYINNIFSYDSGLFYSKSTGDHLSYISNDLDAYMENYVKIQPLYCVSIIACVIYAAAALISGKLFSLLMIGVSLLGLLMMKIFSPIQEKRQDEYIKYRPVFVSCIKDYVAGKREISQYSAGTFFMKKFHSAAEEDGERVKRVNAVKDISRSVDVVFFYLIACVNYSICAYGIYKGQLQVGDMVFLTQLSNDVTDYISNISRYKIMMNSVKLKDSFSSASKPESQGIKIKKVEKIKKIELKEVTAAYEEQRVLNNVSYIFEGNQSYMILGKSGSGKSTFLQLLLKVNENYLGDIYFNETNLKYLNKTDIYDAIGYIPQETFIFNKSLKENITFEESEDITDLLREFHIEHLQDAFLLGNGENISQGERKRIDIARNIRKTPKVLLADEITASLDLANKLNVINMLTENKSYILISVSHDYTYEMLQMYDHIVELKDGKLFEVEKDELYKKE